MGKHLTDTQRQQIRDLFRQTQSTRLVADRLGLPVTKVAAALKRDGVRLNRHKVGACDRRRDDVIRLAAAGTSLSAIARAVGTNKTRLREWLARNGVPHTPHRPGGPGNGRWKGGRRVDKAGYVLLWIPDHPDADSHGLVREHRLVMEQKLRRRLLPSEVVHHKDNDPGNNEPDNLDLYPSNAVHLADTLAGKVPNHTPEGIERMRERGRRLGVIRRTASPPPSTTGAVR